MNRGLLKIYLLFSFVVLISCSDSDSDDSSKDGYAPNVIEKRELVFDRNGEWNFSATHNKRDAKVQINATSMSIAYDKMEPEYSYNRLSDNVASYSLEFYHKGWVPYYEEYTYGYNYYELNLIFTSVGGGTYSGTRNNGSKSESRSGTFKFK